MTLLSHIIIGLGIFQGRLGTYSNSFTGVFDGLGHSISNLTINRGSQYYVGLFGATDNSAILRNVGLEGASVKGDGLVGGLLGRNSNSSISNSYATGSVEGNYDVGGLVGHNTNSSITNSYATGSVVVNNNSAGGLVGYNFYSSIANSYATSSVKGVTIVGGLVGFNYSSSIANSYATGSVEGFDFVGGLVGENYINSSIANSYATGSVVGNNYVGGLVGYNYISSIANSYATGSVEGNSDVGGLVGWNYFNSSIANSYATGSVVGQSNVGGLLGYSSNNFSIENSFWDTETSGQANSAGGKGKTSAEMQDPFTFINAGWDFENTWGKSYANENDGYMMLKSTQAGQYYDGFLNMNNVSRAYGDTNPVINDSIEKSAGFGAFNIVWGEAAGLKANAGTYAWDTPGIIDASGKNIYIFQQENSKSLPAA